MLRIGQIVITRNGLLGKVAKRFREPTGYYYLYEVELENGKTITTRYIKAV
jgi:hypothetical protein